VDVRLRPVRDDELPDWLESLRTQYARDISENAGMSPEGARRKADRDLQSLFPDGRPGEGHELYVVEGEAGEAIGRAWLADREDPQGRLAFVYDVFLDARVRGKGLGRRTMELLEREARRRGHDRIQLNVFGGNEIARSLYRSLGYREVSVFMGKELE
jgi:GNAT superfamily N-acetyltransferase